MTGSGWVWNEYCECECVVCASERDRVQCIQFENVNECSSCCCCDGVKFDAGESKRYACCHHD